MLEKKWTMLKTEYPKLNSKWTLVNGKKPYDLNYSRTAVLLARGRSAGC